MAIPHWCSVLEIRGCTGHLPLGILWKTTVLGGGESCWQNSVSWKQLGMSGSCWLFSTAAGSTLKAPGTAGAWHLRGTLAATVEILVLEFAGEKDAGETVSYRNQVLEKP